MSISNLSPISLVPATRQAPPPPRDDGDRDVKPAPEASRPTESKEPPKSGEAGEQATQFNAPPKADADALAQAKLDAPQDAAKQAQANADQTARATQAAKNAYGSTKALFG